MNQTNVKIGQLRDRMKELGIDAYLVPTADFHESEYVGEFFKCRHFLTGFNGTAGTAVITMDKAGLWTDGRYFVQAEEQLSGSEIKLYRMGEPEFPTLDEFLEEELPVDGCLGFDGRVVNSELGYGLQNLLQEKNVTINCSKDLVGEIWTSRPAMSCEPIWSLDVKYAGKSTVEKLSDLRDAMKKNKAQIHLMTALDEIAWLFNLRGNDIVNNPVFLSYALITQDEAYLYVQKEAIKEDTKMGKEVCAALAEAKVQVKEYAEFLQDVAALKNEKILLERKKASFAVCESIDASCRIIDEMNPCATMKAVKNATEIENMRRAHLKDGIAVTKFMYWLKHTIGTCDMTEMTAAHKIEELRAEQGNYIEPSFVTIAAYKENAAMCHYHPSDEVCKKLKPEGLLLVDSGGQYLEGTTDITRTYALGPLTEKEKEYYTIVAAAMLKVSTMKFLHGCRGINLDYTIREAFWKRGLDFAHGTGHGVGYLSNVHERPNGLRWKVVPERQDSAVIEPGMICSDEPGLYFAGDFGTRTENLILCVEDEKNEYGQFLKFEFLTKAPIDLEALDTRFMDDADIERLNTYHKDVYETISPYMNDEEKEWLKHVTREISR
ncbi:MULTISPECIES: aminopeptidase P family N-terminal domain-containing protein [Clostridium]|uniref:Peptidase M24 n=2 Tax=Clostridium TaxID=1485 RepID=A0A2T3FRW1_9CLOT|nr:MULTISPECIES: aminopeptidase P family N-terminal domain-containing protein [Clostridium]MBD9273886.1 M24 family metallopeptidase [Clostridium sp.]MCC2171954.1 aminopeptidase P family N-terminal domain-containing protein [Clostridium fessum]PST38017.1 peptidase M24 [Clostridium fessum]RHO12128.1 M24 family metallopeptidase [Clostridium sp. AM18-55]RHP39636.1 M24 family metallopeptidase [Clostridium sp. AF32-7AC]